jgi:hypothetical protein
MRTILAILLGGSVAGSLYIMSAVAHVVSRGGSAKSTLQYIASGILGESALHGGWTTAIFGLALHFAIVTVMAAAFVIAARRFPILVERPWSSGILYGAVLYVAMTFFIGPLSAAPRWHVGGGWAMVGGLLAHCFYVGLPIATIARRLRQHKRQRKTYGAII